MNEVIEVPEGYMKITDIIVDADIYPRLQDTWMNAYAYAQAMKAGAVFPPVNVGTYKGKFYLIDGLHRMKANQMNGVAVISVSVKKYKDKKSMFVDAVQLNNTHGKPLTVRDKTLIFSKLKSYKLPDIEISKLLGTPVDKFQVYVSRLTTVDGHERPIMRPLVDALKKQLVSEADVEVIYKSGSQDDYVSRRAVHALQQVVTMFKDGVMPIDEPVVQTLCSELLVLLQDTLKVKSDSVD